MARFFYAQATCANTCQEFFPLSYSEGYGSCFERIFRCIGRLTRNIASAGLGFSAYRSVRPTGQSTR